MDIDKAVNLRIVEARHALGLSQARFAEGLKISCSYLASIETLKRRVNDRILRLVAVTYGVNEEWLKTGSRSMFDQIEDFKLDQLIQIFKKLDGSFQDYVLKQLDMLLALQEGR